MRQAQQGTGRIEAQEAQIDLRVRRSGKGSRQDREPGERRRRWTRGGATLGQSAEEARAERRVAQTLLGKHHVGVDRADRGLSRRSRTTARLSRNGNACSLQSGTF